MSVRSTTALNRIHQMRHVQRFCAISAGLVFAAGSLYSFVSRSQKEQAKPIVTHALTLCRAFAPECHLEGEPRFLHEQVPLPSTRAMKRPLWYVPVRANGASYVMMLRADTMRLCYLFHLSPWADSANIPAAKSAQTRANLAVSQSLLYLQRLKTVAPETEIALERQPESLREETGWRIVWKTRSPSASKEEKLRIVISQQNGRLLQIADTAALNEVVM